MTRVLWPHTLSETQRTRESPLGSLRTKSPKNSLDHFPLEVSELDIPAVRIFQIEIRWPECATWWFEVGLGGSRRQQALPNRDGAFQTPMRDTWRREND